MTSSDDKKGGGSNLIGAPTVIFDPDLEASRQADLRSLEDFGSLEKLSLELQQAVNRSGQVIMVLTMPPDAGIVGIIPA